MSLPHELRALAAFRADVLTAIARVFAESIFASHRATARGLGVDAAECGAVTFVHRFGGSLNLNVHLHVVVLDGVYSRDREGRAVFDSLPPPTDAALDKILVRVEQRISAWLRRRGIGGDGERGDGACDTPAESALDACAGIAMQRGTRVTIARERDTAGSEDEPQLHARRSSIAVERSGFNLNAAVRIAAGDDLGRERLCRYGARPALSLARLRRLPGDRVAYRIK